MFTVIDNTIYQVSGEKMRKVVIDNGVLKVDGKVEKYDNSSILITANELRRQYAELFKVKEDNFNLPDEELLKKIDEKDSEIKLLKEELDKKDSEIENLSKELEEKKQLLEKTQDKENLDKENPEGIKKGE